MYDADERTYTARGLNFRHTDNINKWFLAMKSVGFPEKYFPETVDVYDNKNMPKAVYCVHALSMFLSRRGVAPKIKSLSEVKREASVLVMLPWPPSHVCMHTNVWTSDATCTARIICGQF